MIKMILLAFFTHSTAKRVYSSFSRISGITGPRTGRLCMTTSFETPSSSQSTIEQLRTLASESQRGQKFTNERLKESITSLITTLETKASNSNETLKLLPGRWELIYAEDDITRSSPFFWAFRKAFNGAKTPMKISSSDSFVDNVFCITDTIPFKSIGKAQQIIEDNKLTSRVRINMALGGTTLASSTMTTTAQLVAGEDPSLVEVQLDTTEVLDSTIESYLPALKDKLKFPSGSALELLSPGSSTVYMRVTYIDESLRIVRNADDNKAYVFVREIF